MSRHHKKRRLATLAACVGSTIALAGLGSAGSAMALTCQSPGYGSGSSLQSAAMNTVWLAPAGFAAHTTCSSAPSITYTKTASGPGLEEFGNTGEPAGELHPEADPVAFASSTGTKDAAGQVLDWFAATDDPPSQGELGEAETAAGAAHLAEITIPVAQSPVALDMSLPTGCLIPSGSSVDISNKTLGQLFEGENAPSGKDPGGIQAQGGYAIDTWGALFTQLGYEKVATNPPTEPGTFHDEGGSTGCAQAITPQVRQTESGTSFVWKNYLAQVNRTVWNTFANDFVTWPTSDVVTSDPLSPPGVGTQLNDTGSHLAGNTAANPGSVGYTNPADAGANGGFTNAATASTYGTGGGHSASHQILWAQIQNNGTGSVATYEDPLLPASTVANCETTKLIPSDRGFPYSYTDSWYGVVATDPNISADAGPSDYPICGLTYDLVWHHYSNVNLYGKTETAQNIANTVRNLFEYITGQGQLDIQSHDYARFPTGFAGHVAQAVNPGIGY